MRTWIVIGALLIVSFRAAGEPLPAPVEKARQQMIQDCRPGEAVFGAEYVQKADFNGDGTLDYLVDDGHVRCEGSGFSSCGAGGCSIEVYVSTPSGHRDAGLDLLAFGATIERRPGEAPSIVVTDRREGRIRHGWRSGAFERVRE